ncbi:MAG: hypothetical protein M3Y72_14460 [Acidobacteriota bacterium]|nr:hypothetical protein [Acidobacteriota bacterium]
MRFVSRSVLAWTAEEKAVIGSAWNELAPTLDHLQLPLPKTIYFVKTTGEEEGEQEYTRGTAIILPQSAVDKTKTSSLKGTIAHELFHVLSRNAPELRGKLYETIGFLPCEEISFPPALADRKLTDPDAPKNDHYIRLRLAGKAVLAVPILYSKAAHYDTSKGGPFFQYVEFRFLLVNKERSSPSVVVYNKLSPALVTPDQVSDFYEQVGRNTNYIVHPEEILADNFKFLLMGTSNLPSPAVLQRLSSVLK